MFREKTINLDLFKFSVLIHLTDDLDDAINRFDVIAPDALAFCSQTDAVNIVVAFDIFHDDFNVGVVAHEALHAVNYMLKKLNYINYMDNDEVPCYMLEYITNEIYDFINETKPTWTNQQD